MNEGKQIGEMKRIASKCMTSWLNNETPKAFPDYIAEALYTAGFYKQSEGEWIDVEDTLLYRYKCSLCGEIKLGKMTNFCPNCGSRMK